jgi:predicted transcriptional regulator
MSAIFLKETNNLSLSRMEKYLAIIKVLDDMDSITQKQVIQRAGLESDSSKELFNFLVKLDIIIERNLGAKKVYSITEKGQRICTYFRLDDDGSIFDGTGIFRID